MATTFSRERLRGHRDGQGLTLADLGARTEINPNTLRSYETGQAQPPARRLKVLADGLGVAIEDLYARHDDPVHDYIDAVASHGPPMPDEAIEAAAQVLRTIRRHLHPAAAASRNVGDDGGRARAG